MVNVAIENLHEELRSCLSVCINVASFYINEHTNTQSDLNWLLKANQTQNTEIKNVFTSLFEPAAHVIPCHWDYN